ncbi:MAG: hypothetical protein MUE97_01425 [Phycisphaerales bacterium]|nr:hypothetical protein [Phycisphaerales bacterium]
MDTPPANPNPQPAPPLRTLRLTGSPSTTTTRRAAPGISSAETLARLKMRRGPRSASAKLVEQVYAESLTADAAKPGAASLETISHADPRWQVAVRTNYLLDGGRAALLTPERRRAVLDLAETLGLRAFDANLIIAIVQDSRRTTGEGLTPETRHRLAMIRPGENPDRRSPWAFAAGVLIFAGMLTWALSRAFVTP